MPPPIPPRRDPTPSTGSGWQPFFFPDMTPTPTFTTLMNDIFSCLDPQNTGTLLPETHSRFLDDIGYLPHENTWKSGLTATFNQSAVSNADKTLKNAFDLFAIDHELLQRAQGPHIDPTGLTQTLQGVLGSAFSSIGSQAAPPMPAITRKGFVDVTVINVLSDPSREWANFSRMLRKYNLPRYIGWGDLPRSVIPAVADQAMLNRIAGVTAFAKQKGEAELEAARRKAAIQARGRQAALDLIGDTRYEYRYV
ncbi:hypothetical protein DXG01_005946 [Tephrocybe rancida]|nr:hypothetical protein DXG01_005946 [Tephrocybe rancida]